VGTRDGVGGSFPQGGRRVPEVWSQNATNIVAQKYLRGSYSSPARERRFKQMIGRVSGTISEWGRERGTFASARDGDTFEASCRTSSWTSWRR